MSCFFNPFLTLISILIVNVMIGCDDEPRLVEADASSELDLTFTDQFVDQALDQTIEEADMRFVELSPLSEGPCGPQYTLRIVEGEEHALRGRTIRTHVLSSCHPTPEIASEGALIEIQSEVSDEFILRVEHEIPIALELSTLCTDDRNRLQCLLTPTGENESFTIVQLIAGESQYLSLQQLSPPRARSLDFTVHLIPVSAERLIIRELRAFLGESIITGGGIAQAKLAVQVSAESLSRGINAVELTLTSEDGTERTLPRLNRAEFSQMNTEGDRFTLVLSGLIEQGPSPLKSVSAVLIDRDDVESERVVANIETPAQLAEGDGCDDFGLAVCTSPLVCAELISAEAETEALPSRSVCQQRVVPEVIDAELTLDLSEVKIGIRTKVRHEGFVDGDEFLIRLSFIKTNEEASERTLDLNVVARPVDVSTFVIQERFSFFEELFDIYGAYDHQVRLEVIDQRGVKSESVLVSLSPSQRCDIDEVLASCGLSFPCLADRCQSACSADEGEPFNNRRVTAPALEELSLEGTFCGRDHDYLSVNVNPHEEIVLALSGFDDNIVIPVIELIAESGDLIARSEDRPLRWRNRSPQGMNLFVKLSTLAPQIASRYRLQLERRLLDPSSCTDDAYEINDLFTEATPWTRAELISSEERLSLCGDVDVYEVILEANQSITANVELIEGELECAFYTRSQQRVGPLKYIYDRGTSTLTNRSQQTQSYYFELTQVNSEDVIYTLSFDETPSRCLDPYEPNNTFAEESLWSALEGNPREETLSICGDDEDLFAFDLAPGDELYAEVRLDPLTADLDLELYDQLGLVDVSATTNDVEWVSFINRSDRVERISLVIYPYEWNDYAEYHLWVNIIPAQCSEDSFEPNDRISEASLLPLAENSDMSGALTLCGQDLDYFLIELAPNEELNLTGRCSTGSTQDLNLTLYNASTGDPLDLCNDQTDESLCSGRCVWRDDECQARDRASIYYVNPQQETENLVLRVSPSSISLGQVCTYRLFQTPPLDACDDRYEPNDEIHEAVPTALTSLIQASESHSLCQDDVDLYQVSIAPRELITARVTALDGTPLPRASLINEATLETHDATWTQGQSRFVTFVNPNDFTIPLYLKVSAESPQLSSYRLHIDHRSIDLCEEDQYEPNDRLNTATSSEESRAHDEFTTLSACESSDDLYQVILGPYERLEAKALFNPALAELELSLLSSDGTLMSSSLTYLLLDEPETVENDADEPLEVYVSVSARSLAFDAVSAPYQLSLSVLRDVCEADEFEPNDVINELDLSTVLNSRDNNLLSDAQLNACFGDFDLFPIELAVGESLSAVVTAEDEAVSLDVLLYADLDTEAIDRSSSTFGLSEVVQYTNETESPAIIYLEVSKFISDYGSISSNYRIELLFSDTVQCSPDRFEPNGDHALATPASTVATIASNEPISACGFDLDYYELQIPAQSAVRVDYSINEDFDVNGDYLMKLYVGGESLEDVVDKSIRGGFIYYENRLDQAITATLEVENAPAVESYYYLNIEDQLSLCEREPYELGSDRTSNDSINEATPSAQSRLIRDDESLGLCLKDQDWYEIELASGEQLLSQLYDSDGVSVMLRSADGDLLRSKGESITYQNTSSSTVNVYLGVVGDDLGQEYIYYLNNEVSEP